MRIRKTRKQNKFVLLLLGLCVIALLTFLILLQSSNLWKSFEIETASDTLLLYALSSLNFIAFVVFGFIFLRSVIRLVRERRTLQLGSKIKTRLFLYFAAISLLPLIAMAGFSYLFMNRALERWFTQIPENVVRSALEAQKNAAEQRRQTLLQDAAMLARALEKSDPAQSDLSLIAKAGSLAAIRIVNASGGVAVGAESVPEGDERKAIEQIDADIASGKPVDSAPAFSDQRSFDVATAPMSGGRMLVIAARPLAKLGADDQIGQSLAEFDRLKQKQATVRQIGFLTLGGLTFLLIFASSWTAFYVARGLTAPIRSLAEGADEIAKGNLSYRVEAAAEDELAILVESFNQMSSKLEENSIVLRERQRYIETVLQALPTGVISFDAAGRIGTINRAAKNILRLEDADFSGLELGALLNNENRSAIERMLSRARRIGRSSEQSLLVRENDRGLSNAEASVPVALVATALPESGGVVLVIEDLSELIAAQRASAWQEVARRMAHEIKNPLTPIQLSAERIAKRFGAARGSAKPVSTTVGLDHFQSMRVIDEGTSTILREVQSLKAMVDEFSRFARLPAAKLEKGSLTSVIADVEKIYSERFENPNIRFSVENDLPEALIDDEQIKRVFVNLIENAVEALDGLARDGLIEIRVDYEKERDLLIAEVSDNGRGIKAEDFPKLFQPYFSTKGRGTGLGLAIVRRIITDHGGRIYATSDKPSGTTFTVELPPANAN